MRLCIHGTKLLGSVTIPASKSETHRALICAGLAIGQSRITGLIRSMDIVSTLECLQALGVKAELEGLTARIRGGVPVQSAYTQSAYAQNAPAKSAVLPCRESGSTLRFMLPVALAIGGTFSFSGSQRLMQRPLEEYFEIFRRQNIEYKTDEAHGCLRVSGKLQSGDFSLRGDVSSQFITGLMLALPLLAGDSSIHITFKLESESYINLTLQVMKQFGVTAEKQGSTYFIKGNQQYVNQDYTLEGDYSQAAFWLAVAAMGSSVAVKGLKDNSIQGDRAILNHLRNAGAVITEQNGETMVSKRAQNPIEVDASDCPDLVPVLAVLCTQLSGQSRIYNAQRLRLKESDRLAAISSELSKLGADITQTQDGLLIKQSILHGGECICHNDHRIAMALAVASTLTNEEIILNGCACVNKSYPGFWTDFKSLGGTADECDLREQV